jgi:dihydropteroate synthase
MWKCRDRILDLGSRTAIMGILNVTPDSFSDGGRFFSTDAAIRRGIEMAGQGAAIIDVGGESSRPGAAPVSADEEKMRVLPVIKALASQAGALVSIDTTKAAVARAALEEGAHIVNDISACTMDPEMVDVVRASRAGVVLMHMQGTPRTMQKDPHYGDVVVEVRDYLRSRADALIAAGIELARIAVDPGIGFGKTVEHNVRLLRELDVVAALGFPVVIGVSRKSFLGKVTGRETHDRLAASLGAMALAIRNGAHVARVHDVLESCDCARVADILR